ncbi:MAG: hypothetical protein V1755_14135 [Chloroflexota bacterium]
MKSNFIPPIPAPARRRSFLAVGPVRWAGRGIFRRGVTMIDTSKEHLAAVLGQLLQHLDNEQYTATREMIEAGKLHKWAEGQNAENWHVAMSSIQRQIAGLLTGDDRILRTTKITALIGELREAAGLDPNGDDWPE